MHNITIDYYSLFALKILSAKNKRLKSNVRMARVPVLRRQKQSSRVLNPKVISV